MEKHFCDREDCGKEITDKKYKLDIVSDSTRVQIEMSLKLDAFRRPGKQDTLEFCSLDCLVKSVIGATLQAQRIAERISDYKMTRVELVL